MAWTATLTSITKNAASKQITTVVTINGGAEPYTMEFVQGFGDWRLNQTQMVNEIREFIAKVKDVEQMYAQMKALEGQNIPIGL